MTVKPDNTGQKQADAWFKPGQSGNPAGRPKGSRNRLSEQFVADFCEVWTERGIEALRKLAVDDPAAFVRAAVALVPKQLEHTGADGDAIQIESDLGVIERRRRVAAFLLKLAGLDELGVTDAQEDADAVSGSDSSRPSSA